MVVNASAHLTHSLLLCCTSCSLRQKQRSGNSNIVMVVIQGVKMLSLVFCALGVFCSLKDPRILGHQRSAG